MDGNIEALKRQLEIHQRNLYRLKERAASYGLLNVPLKLQNEIESEEKEIARLKEEIARLGGREQERRAQGCMVTAQLWWKSQRATVQAAIIVALGSIIVAMCELWSGIPQDIVRSLLITPTPAPIAIATNTPTPTSTATAAPTNTPTPTPTPTVTPTNTSTPTATPKNTLTPTATPTVPPTSTPDAVIVDHVNLRSGPGEVYDVIGTLSPNQVLTVTGRNADASWLQVNTDQMQEGWVVNRPDLVTLNLPVAEIPIVSTPLPRSPEPPMPEPMSFQNFEPDNGTPPGEGNYFWDAWFTTCSFESAVVREGSRAVRVDAHAAAEGNPGDRGGTMGINPSSSEPIDLSSATTLSVWVYDTLGNNTLQLRLRDNNDALSNEVWSEMHAEKNNWTEITWTLSDFTGIDLSQIKNIELYEWWDGVYYFDAVSWEFIPPPKPPMPTQMSLQNFEPDNGTPDPYFEGIWKMNCEFEYKEAYQGSRSLKCHAHWGEDDCPECHGGTVRIYSSSDPIDLSPFKTISIWVYDAQGDNTVQLRLRDNNDALSNEVWSEMHAEKNNWTEITWTLSAFTDVNKSAIRSIEIYEWNDGVYYFDAVGWQ